MIIIGKVKKIVSNGYERNIEIEVTDKNIGCFWCYFVEPIEYLEFGDESATLKVGEEKK